MRSRVRLPAGFQLRNEGAVFRKELREKIAVSLDYRF